MVNPLFKLYFACKYTFRCLDPTHAELGADCPRLVCLFIFRKEDIYPITQKCFPSFNKVANVPETLAGCVSNPHEGRFLLDTSISSPPPPAPQTSQLLTPPSNTAQKTSHPKTPSKNIFFFVQNTVSCRSHRQSAPSSLTCALFQGLS